MIRPSGSPIVVLACKGLAIIIQLFAIYVIFHGHYSPGGGFQGGALFAASILLLRMSEGGKDSQQVFPSNWSIVVGSCGALIYILIGFLAMIFGGVFLDYSFLPLASDPANIRFIAILLIEVGVGIAVTASLVSIFDDLSAGEIDD